MKASSYRVGKEISISEPETGRSFNITIEVVNLTKFYNEIKAFLKNPNKVVELAVKYNTDVPYKPVLDADDTNVYFYFLKAGDDITVSTTQARKKFLVTGSSGTKKKSIEFVMKSLEQLKKKNKYKFKVELCRFYTPSTSYAWFKFDVLTSFRLEVKENFIKTSYFLRHIYLLNNLNQLKISYRESIDTRHSLGLTMNIESKDKILDNWLINQGLNLKRGTKVSLYLSLNTRPELNFWLTKLRILKCKIRENHGFLPINKISDYLKVMA